MLPDVAQRRLTSTVGQGLFARLVAGFLAVAVPAVVLTGVVLTPQSAAALTASATLASANVARAATSKIESWLAERQGDADAYALALRGQLGQPDLGSRLAALVAANKPAVYDLIEVTDPAGHVVAASSADLQYDVNG